MPEIQTLPYELRARLPGPWGPLGIDYFPITMIDGRAYPGDPQALSGIDDPLVEQLATQFSAAAVAERDAALQQVADLTTERAELLAQVAALQQQVEDLTPPAIDPDAVPESITRRQGRMWLFQEGLLEAVEILVQTAGPTAGIDYEAHLWYRSSPWMTQFAAVLGKTEAEVDDFFREAAVIE